MEKQLNIRLSENLRSRFDELVKSSGLKQADLIAMLLNLAEKDELKDLIPDAATDIDAFDSHAHAMRDAYVAAIKRANDAYAIAADKVRSELQALGTLTQQNQQLQQENHTIKSELDEAKSQIVRLKSDLSQAQALAEDAIEMKRHITDLREQLVTLREQHAAELNKVRAEGFSQLLEVLKTQQQS